MTRFYLVSLMAQEGGAVFGVNFAQSLLPCRKTAPVSLRTLVFFFPLVTYTFPSFNAT